MCKFKNLFPYKKGKVRNIYDLDDKILIVASDRISAFDYILPNFIPDGKLLLIDEILTPGSSRFYDASIYRKRTPQENYDKQFVRDYISDKGIEKINNVNPNYKIFSFQEILLKKEKYLEAYQKITGKDSIQ
ncbi:MAG: phosphoribosylaminoimidazolesuccinocarboxamide synthase [Candidatus Cloacimonadota bacterium]|nr:phosphoribosylaminoimidazolesuccinocarboxamide synthase [Candidatus Cloacimonadota bacterium]